MYVCTCRTFVPLFARVFCLYLYNKYSVCACMCQPTLSLLYPSTSPLSHHIYTLFNAFPNPSFSSPSINFFPLLHPFVPSPLYIPSFLCSVSCIPLSLPFSPL